MLEKNNYHDVQLFAILLFSKLISTEEDLTLVSSDMEKIFEKVCLEDQTKLLIYMPFDHPLSLKIFRLQALTYESIQVL